MGMYDLQSVDPLHESLAKVCLHANSILVAALACRHCFTRAGSTDPSTVEAPSTEPATCPTCSP